MSEPIARRQMFEYDGGNPFHIYSLPRHTGTNPLLFNHWHEELEIVYIIQGNSLHYIDGTCIRSCPGRLIVVNSESVHNIIPIIPRKGECREDEDVVVVLIISREFLEQAFPKFQSMYFLNKKEQTLPEIRELMLKMAKYKDGTPVNDYEKVYIRGMALQLLYHICQEGVAERDVILPINSQKNIERLKGILQYMEQHYMEKISQSYVADKFYFSREYFARFFKQNTGMTFVEYLTKYRVQRARAQLISSDDSVLSIALSNGFSDDRRLILAFKGQYGITPLQYRKMERNRQNVNCV